MQHRGGCMPRILTRVCQSSKAPGLGRAQVRRTGGRGGGEGSISTTDPGAGAGCNCRSWCEEGPRAGAEALGKTIRVVSVLFEHGWSIGFQIRCLGELASGWERPASCCRCCEHSFHYSHMDVHIHGLRSPGWASRSIIRSYTIISCEWCR